MTDEQALEILVYLAAAYPQREITEETARVYREHLLPLEHDAARAAAVTLVDRCKWFPTIAEIRDAVGLLENRYPTPAHAWSQVLEAAATHTRALMHPLVRRTFDLTINDTYEPSLSERTRRFFLETYSDELAREELSARRDGVARILGSEAPTLEAGEVVR